MHIWVDYIDLTATSLEWWEIRNVPRFLIILKHGNFWTTPTQLRNTAKSYRGVPEMWGPQVTMGFNPKMV